MLENEKEKKGKKLGWSKKKRKFEITFLTALYIVNDRIRSRQVRVNQVGETLLNTTPTEVPNNAIGCINKTKSKSMIDFDGIEGCLLGKSTIKLYIWEAM